MCCAYVVVWERYISQNFWNFILHTVNFVRQKYLGLSLIDRIHKYILRIWYVNRVLLLLDSAFSAESGSSTLHVVQVVSLIWWFGNFSFNRRIWCAPTLTVVMYVCYEAVYTQYHPVCQNKCAFVHQCALHFDLTNVVFAD